jgi:putative membrane-bound dehydrogenase-like protein
MLIRRILLPSLLLVSSLSWSAEFPTPTNNQPVTTPLLSPEESLAKMHLPPGFKATVFAGEPDVQQPIACCWDERGRLWVAENYTYSDGHERFDLKLRDRILIFEDTDNDGHFDKRTVFCDDLQMLTSIERGFGGVYAMCPPHLLFIPTKDDKPTGPPQVLLDGFSTTAASRHTFANGLKWGPDGWLYGRVGISSTSWIDVPGTPQEKRHPTAGGIWRYHPTRKIYQPYCHGTTNPWGMDWDDHGEMFFINTVIGHFWHGIQGAHFKRMHGEDPYDHIYEFIDQHADHYHWDTGEAWSDTKKAGPSASTSEKGGGHAHVGLTIYQGTNWPKEYRGKALTLNLHGHRVNVDRIEPQGSGYVAKHEPDILKTDDPWFRGTEITYGPDGGVYILDWSDIGECHESDGVHRTSGRIYKITYGDPVKPKESDLTKLSDEELVKLQLSDNEWLVRMARWELRERGSNGTLSKEAQSSVVATLKQASLPVGQQLRLYWTAKQLGITLSMYHEDVVKNEALAGWMIRFAGVPSNNPQASSSKPADPGDFIASLKGIQSSQPLRLILASKCIGDDNLRSRFMPGLLSHAEDATDHNLPLMYWAGLRDLPSAELVKLFAGCRIPLVRQFMARRITEDIDKDAAPLNTLLGIAAKSDTPELRDDTLTGMTAALKGWRKAKKPEAWDAFATKLEGTPLAAQVRDLNVLFGDGRALDQVRAIALDDKADPEARRAALKTIIDAKAPEARDLCLKFLPDRSFGLTAVQGLATFDDPELALKIINRYNSFYPHERASVIAALVSRPSFAKVLLDRIARGNIPRADLTPIHARQIRSFNNEELNKKLTEAWGELRDSSEDKKQLISALKAKLTRDVIAKADQSQGRMIFASVCAACHKLYGEGASIGPDLTGSGRHEVNYLIENIADPSALVAADFKMSVFTLKDGRVLNGIIHAQTDRTITVAMVGQEVTIDRGDIVKQEQMPISMMPEGQLLALSDEQVRNLFAYLMGNSQVAMPGAQ